jgi:hypothetical protein
MSEWTSRRPEFLRLAQQAEDSGLDAAAQVGVNAMRKSLRPGYTSGDFRTGESVRHVTKGLPFTEGATRAIRYGTDLLYNLFWELGFRQRLWVWRDRKTGKWYSRRDSPTRFVRVEKWRPAFIVNRQRMAAAYNRVFKRTLARFDANRRGA